MSNPAPSAPIAPPPGRILGMADVLRETSFGRTTLWRRIRDGEFPPPIPLGGRRVGWPERDVEAWKAKMIAARH